MKSKKLSALIAIILAFALLVPFTASASNILKVNPQISADRATIAQLRSDIVGLKQQAKAIVKEICIDLKGTKNDDSITSSQDYQDIVTLIQSLKTTLGKAEASDYTSVLKSAQGKSGADKLTALQNVIALETQKKADLTTAIASLNNALTKANAIAALKTGSSSGTSGDSNAQLIQDKQTIDQNTAQIAQAFADDRNIISQIIATASANKTILKADPNDVATIESQLKTVTTTLKGIYDGSVAADCKQFNTDKKNKDDTAMLTELSNIITIQQTRITTLASTKSQLQDILNQLNTIISSSSASV
jgi:hypothetical protein